MSVPDDHAELRSPQAWQAVADYPGWLVLMDHAHGYKQPRLVTSDTDRAILVDMVRTLFPGHVVRVASDNVRKFLVRRPPS